MISYLHGTLKRKLPDRVIVDVNGVGYDVFLPQFVLRSVEEREVGEPVEFEIYYHVSERQLRPTLIGFNNPYEKQFFEKFITVEDIGPQRAARALIFSVSKIAQAIESEDVALLRKLPGIGPRTVAKMVATLRGKVTEEALLQDEGFASVAGKPAAEPATDLRDEVIAVLLTLGHRRAEATTMVDAALRSNPDVATSQELINEVYRLDRVGAQAAT